MQTQTLKQVIDSLVSAEIKIKDCSTNGRCSKCGECCSNFLPVSQKEINTIQKYVIEHNIRPQNHMLVMQNTLTCPYHNGKKCLIYDVRPLICKEFYCYKEPTAKMTEKFKDEEYITVNMWQVAEKIDEYFRR